MDGLRKPWVERTMAAVYIFLSFISFYCVCLRLPVGVKYGIDLVVGAWAIISFFLKPRFEHAKFCSRFFVMYFMPFLMFWLWSVVIWVLDFQTTDYIIRGSKNIIYMLVNILYICAGFYLFGRKVIYYTFHAMWIANIAVFFEIGMKYGFGTLFSQYIRLLTSFANITGPVVRYMELHDMVYAWGLYMVYFALHKEEHWWQNALYLSVAIFFFSFSLKRIGLIAIAIAIIAGFVYMNVRRRNKRKMITITTLLLICMAFAYIVMVRSGAFTAISEQFGINLMGREDIFKAYDDYYVISPTYLGQGIRFIYNHGETTGGVDTIHNVYLELYIELGFFVWLIWMYYDMQFRNKWIAKNYTYDAAAYLFAACIYMFITFTTDNTYFYFGVNVTYRMFAMVWCYDVAKKKGLIGKKDLYEHDT